jgi:PBP1b-binding outer membrane lipoprotein LpoB
MKKYILLFFAVLLLSACSKNLQVSSTKQPVYSTKQPKFPVLTLPTTTVIPPVVLQAMPTSKIVLPSTNIYEQAYYQIRQML